MSDDEGFPVDKREFENYGQPPFLKSGQYECKITAGWGVDNGRIGRMVKTALLKAGVMYCQQNGIHWALATGRAPIDRQYERLLFKDVFPGRGPIPFRHVGNMPHRVLCFEMLQAERMWQEANHPLLDFMCRTHHPDIRVPMTAPRGRPQPRLHGGMAGELAVSRLA